MAYHLISWRIERIVHFDFGRGDLNIDGLVHFGFHDRIGRHFVLAHQKHFIGFLNKGKLEWTIAAGQVFEETPNIKADIQFPIYVDSLLDGTLVVSNFGNNLLYRVDPNRMEASLFFDGSTQGMKHAGNCVVDDDGYVWINEVEGSRIWRLDSTGTPTLTLGASGSGFQSGVVDFDKVKFDWIYDIRRGPDGNIYVLDSRNFAVRMIDVASSRVLTLAGTGKPGYEGDGGPSRLATFGSDPSARFDGPISLSLDEEGNIYVGDRFNRVVRMIDRKAEAIHTIAGNATSRIETPNKLDERDPMALRLPKISSMEYYRRRLFIPTDLTDNTGDLIVMSKA